MITDKIKQTFNRRRSGRGPLVTASLTAVSLIMFLACMAVFAGGIASDKAIDATDAIVGTWQGNIPGGPRAATIMVVRGADGLVGAFMGYDYDRPVAGNDGSSIDGPTPKVMRRTGLVLAEPKFDGRRLTFKLTLPSRDGGTRQATGELTLADSDNAEMRLTMPGNRPPLVLKMTRE